MTNNKPNVKLPELPPPAVKSWELATHDTAAHSILTYSAEQVRQSMLDAIALNTPGMDAQEPVAWMTQRALDRFAEHRAGNADAIGYSYVYAMQDEGVPVPLYTHPAPTGVYAAGKVAVSDEDLELAEAAAVWLEHGGKPLAAAIYRLVQAVKGEK